MMNPKVISVGAIILLIQVFLFVNAELFYGELAPLVTSIFSVYFFAILIASTAQPTFISNAIKLSELGRFPVSFFITAVLLVIFSGASGFISASMLPNTAAEIAVASISVGGVISAIGFGSLHLLVKAVDEEIIFRGILPKIIPGTFFMKDIISSLVFGIFHVSVIATRFGMSSQLLGSLILLSLLGYIWSYVARNYGLMSSIASHFAYNLFVLGGLNIFLGGLI